LEVLDHVVIEVPKVFLERMVKMDQLEQMELRDYKDNRVLLGHRVIKV
jgi:hypothetical protein